MDVTKEGGGVVQNHLVSLTIRNVDQVPGNWLFILLGYDAVKLGGQFPPSERIIVPSSLGVYRWTKNNLCSCEMLGSVYSGCSVISWKNRFLNRVAVNI